MKTTKQKEENKMQVGVCGNWLLFLNFIESHPEKDKFLELHREVTRRTHAEQFKHKLYHAEYILKRLEACDFFKLNKVSKN